MEHADLFNYTKLFPAEFAAADSFAAFAAALDGSQPGPGKLLQHIAAKYPGAWDNSFRTIKVHGFVGRPLLCPEARKAADLFAEVSLYPHATGGHYRHEEPHVQAGAAFISETHAKGFAYFGPLGATYGWSPEHLARGSKIRSQRGGQNWLTGAKPTPAVVEAFGATGTDDWDLATFEVVRRDDGRQLVVARSHNGFGSRWLALLDAGETAVSMLSDHERGEIEAEMQRQREAWDEAE